VRARVEPRRNVVGADAARWHDPQFGHRRAQRADNATQCRLSVNSAGRSQSRKASSSAARWREAGHRRFQSRSLPRRRYDDLSCRRRGLSSARGPIPGPRTLRMQTCSCTFRPFPRRVTLDHDDVEAIAGRIADLLTGRRSLPEYLDTAAVASMLHVSQEWVRGHAAELGAVRLGSGPRGTLRFDAARVCLALERRRLAQTPGPPQGPRAGPRRRSGSTVRLLPLPDESRARR